MLDTNNGSFGDLMFDAIVFIFATLFVLGWVWVIMRGVLMLALSAVDWTYEKLFGYNWTFKSRIESIDATIEGIFEFPGNVLGRLLSKTSESTTKAKFILKALLGLMIPLFVILYWLTSSGNPVDKFNLIASRSVAKGFITQVEADSEVVETNDGRTAGERLFYVYDYYFTLPNGRKVQSKGGGDGDIPEKLSDPDAFPIPVAVRYLDDNTAVSRVENYFEDKDSFLEWFRHEVALGLIFTLMAIFIGFRIIKKAWLDFANEAI